MLILVGFFVSIFVSGWQADDGLVKLLTIIGCFVLVVYLMVWGFSKD